MCEKFTSGAKAIVRFQSMRNRYSKLLSAHFFPPIFSLPHNSDFVVEDCQPIPEPKPELRLLQSLCIVEDGGLQRMTSAKVSLLVGF